MPAQIALDLMGGDLAPTAPLEGALQAIAQYDDIELTLIGPPEQREHLLTHLQHPRLHYCPARDVIAMDESPVQAVRSKPESSLVIGLTGLARNDFDAFVSAGNSGATIVGATRALPRLPGVKRPAMAILFPGAQGETVILDVGSQVHCDAEQLVQFARLGHLFARHSLNIQTPRVALLNVGEEANKGHGEVQAAHALLSESNLHFVGNIEGWDLPRNHVDVAVCDGFTGNVVIKLAEGLSEFFMSVCPPLGELPNAQRFHYAEHGGSLLLGLDGTVVITHGRSSANAIANAIALAQRTLKEETLRKMKAELINEVS